MTSVISKITLAAVCVSSLMVASDKETQIKKENIFHDQGHPITHDKRGFKVDGLRVQDVDLSADLQGISKKKLTNLFATGKALQATRVGRDWSLKTTERVKGGGPIAGYIAYWTTKALCYGGLAGAAGAGLTAAAAVALPAGTVGAVMAPAVAASLSAAAPAAVGSAAAASMGTGGALLVSTVVASNAAAATGVTLVAAEVATTAAATGGIVASVETASLGVGLFFSGLPFLP